MAMVKLSLIGGALASNYSIGAIVQKFVQKNPKTAAKFLVRLYTQGVTDGKKYGPKILKSRSAIKHLLYSFSPSTRGLAKIYDAGVATANSTNETIQKVFPEIFRNSKGRFVFSKPGVIKAFNRVESTLIPIEKALSNPARISLLTSAAGGAIGAGSAKKDHKLRGGIIGSAAGFAVPYAGIRFARKYPMVDYVAKGEARDILHETKNVISDFMQ